MEGKVLNSKNVKIQNGTLPIELHQITDYDGDTAFCIVVDGTEWLITYYPMHAAVLFDMFVDHLTSYVHYVAISGEE